MNIYLVLILTVGMSIAVFRDFKDRKIPNLITFPMMLAGLTFHLVNSGLPGLGFSAFGLIVGIGVFFIPYLLGGMGAGDAKLMGAAGALLGAAGVALAAAISALFGFIYAIILLVVYPEYGRSFLERTWLMSKTFLLTRQLILIPAEKTEKKPTLSYALPIALGTLFCVFLKVTGSNLIQEFLGFQFSI